MQDSFQQELTALFERQNLRLDIMNRDLKISQLNHDLRCANKEIEILSSYIDYLEGRKNA